MILSEVRFQNQQKLRSLGPCFSKIYGKILRSQLRFYLDKFLSEFLSLRITKTKALLML